MYDNVNREFEDIFKKMTRIIKVIKFITQKQYTDYKRQQKDSRKAVQRLQKTLEKQYTDYKRQQKNSTQTLEDSRNKVHRL